MVFMKQFQTIFCNLKCCMQVARILIYDHVFTLVSDHIYCDKCELCCMLQSEHVCVILSYFQHSKLKTLKPRVLFFKIKEEFRFSSLSLYNYLKVSYYFILTSHNTLYPTSVVVSILKSPNYLREKNVNVGSEISCQT